MSSFFRSTVTLGSGNIIAQLITVLTIPLITRLFTPEDFGVFSMVFSVVMILTPLLSLQYHAAIVLPESRNDSVRLALLCLILIVCTGLFLLSAIYLVSTNLPHLISKYSWYEYIYFIPLIAVIYSINDIYIFYNLKVNQYSRIAKSRVGMAVIDRLCAVLSGLVYGSTPIILFSSRIVGLIGSIFMLSSFFRKTRLSSRFVKNEMSAILALASRYKEFPIYSVWSVFLNKLSIEFPVILLSIYFSALTVGLYALVVRVVNMPMMAVGDAISKVYYQKMAGFKNEDNIDGMKNLTMILLKYMIYMSFGVCVWVYQFSDEFFQYAFGDQWVEAGSYLTILIIPYMALFVSRPILSLFDVFYIQKYKLAANSIMLTLRLVAMVVAIILTNDIYISLTSLAVVTVATYCVLIYLLLRLINIEKIFYFKMAKELLFELMPFITVVVAVYAMSIDNVLVVLFSYLVATLYQLYFLVKKKNELKNIINVNRGTHD